MAVFWKRFSFSCFSLIAVLLSWAHKVQCELVHVQSFNGIIGAENFTYYKLTLEGHVIVKLQSLEGDADLYISTESMKPTWNDYSIKSDTCSDEIAIVHRYQQRPIGIGVYGYVQYQLSTFRLSVYLDSDEEIYYPEDDVDETYDKRSTQHHAKTAFSSVQTEEEEESMLWSLFVGFLKLVLEVLLS